MTDNRVNFPFIPPPMENSGVKNKSRTVGEQESFAGVLEKTKTSGLSFSAHAQHRLQSRSIALGPEELGKLENAVEKAAARGCRSSLLLYGDMAFVAGVQSRTIITALDGKSMKDHLFTNIDSAVVVE
ncbi:MAG: TIGR02530 family flagellar biosynthesis protein [Bacillota bacterium]|nr:TIGR02530 family flagellar biosynthesis protein [Bacillota bacterium]